MHERRVVITGMGTVNPLGNDVTSTWEALLNGRSGIARLTKFDISTYDCQIGGEVKNFDYTKYFSAENVSRARKLDAYIHFAGAAAKEAIGMSGLDIKKDPERVGICIGTGIGGIHTQQSCSNTLLTKGHKRVSPFYIPGFIGNTASGFLSIEFGIEGPNMSVQTACATANHAFGTSWLLIQKGMADVMVCGGTESSLIDIALAGFENMKALSTKYNDRPQEASRPYDIDRDGFVMAEGAGVLVFESLEHALARGANILCEICSVGMTGDAHDMVQPHPDGTGAWKSMRNACKMAGVDPTEIDYINAHGTSTPLGDVAESKAIMLLMGGEQGKLVVGSTKSMHGHLLGATAGVEAVACIKAICDGKIPPNVNLFKQDPAVPLKLFTEVIEKPVNVALSNSFGFGGHNSTLVLKKY